MPIAPQPHVDDVQRIQVQVTQVVLDRRPQFRWRLRRVPRLVRFPPRTHLRHQHQVFGVREQRFVNELVHHMRAVEVAGVNVIDARLDCFLQHLDGFVVVLRRPIHTRPGELHRAVAHAVYSQIRAGKGEGSLQVVHSPDSFG